MWRFDDVQRQNIYNKFGGRCAYCGKPISIDEMQIDQLVPPWHRLSDGQLVKNAARGIDDDDNLMPSCHACNYYKSQLSLEDFRELLKGLPERCAKSPDVQIAMRYGMVDIRKWCGVFLFEFYNISKDEVFRETFGPTNT